MDYPKSNMTRNEMLNKLGFSLEKGRAHLSRTMMLAELTELLRYTANKTIEKNTYSSAIIDDNCLSKRSGRTRLLTARHLSDLYSLDDNYLLFRSLKYFWDRDESSHALTALQMVYARDALIRLSAPFILQAKHGIQIQRQDIENIIETAHPERYSEATLKSAAQNINSTWTKAGHLQGRTKKIRSHFDVGSGAVSYGLLLGYLTGIRGEELFASDYIKLLDLTNERIEELAKEASRKGWIVFKQIGTVIEVSFPNLINQQEMEWLREQN